MTWPKKYWYNPPGGRVGDFSIVRRVVVTVNFQRGLSGELAQTSSSAPAQNRFCPSVSGLDCLAHFTGRLCFMIFSLFDGFFWRCVFVIWYFYPLNEKIIFFHCSKKVYQNLGCKENGGY
jgi:hypothetical protein